MIPLVILLTFVALGAWVKSRSKKHPPLPPGPPGEPLIGHLRLIPPNNQETLFYEWGKKYGDVIYLQFLGRSIVVLNSVQAAVDLLEKRGAIYSDRPKFVIYETMGWTAGLTFFGYGRRFQQHRRMFEKYLTPSKCTAYHPIQTREARVFLQNLLSNPDGRDNFIKRYSTAVIMEVAYGHQITSDDDPYVKISQDSGDAVQNAGPPGSTPVDLFPFLRHLPSWFPGSFYAGFARDHKYAIDALHNYPFEEVSKLKAEGKGNNSFLSAQLDEYELKGSDSPVTLEDIKGASGLMYCAGTDSTWSTISMFFLAMVLFPEHQTRAQKEIDAAIGSGRLPEFHDHDSLPYIECILQETLRWNSAVPTGVPHRLSEDDVYNGMFIPKGSLIIPNTSDPRGMTLDENVYSDPFTFNPARFLPKPEGNGEPYAGGPFGFGRRICPGRHLAHASLWIAMASTLATMNITKKLDANGKEITPEIAFTSGITSHPRPYQCSIKPRTEAAKDLIVQGYMAETF
ncbi:cytochrome P450 [Collybia nuda]|uniref:Cytochrome P450 n=1 Tax=Collybia nuda TaxID=64659 RepID=A0A9P5XTZ9_9AGAR|nr:cytochrome P450 [Collybia nuda]